MPLGEMCRSICTFIYVKDTRPAAIAEKESIMQYCLEQPCSMLMIAIPDVEI